MTRHLDDKERLGSACHFPLSRRLENPLSRISGRRRKAAGQGGDAVHCVATLRGTQGARASGSARQLIVDQRAVDAVLAEASHRLARSYRSVRAVLPSYDNFRNRTGLPFIAMTPSLHTSQSAPDFVSQNAACKTTLLVP